METNVAISALKSNGTPNQFNPSGVFQETGMPLILGAIQHFSPQGFCFSAVDIMKFQFE